MRRAKTIIVPGNSKIVIAKTLVMKKKIFVADDDPGIRDIFSIIFKKAGYDVELTGDAEDVLKNKFTLPDIFLIDKQLSGYNGLDLCVYLKNNPRTKDIPVIMVSAAPDIDILSKQAGADAFIEKPFDMGELLKLISGCIESPARCRDSGVVRKDF